MGMPQRGSFEADTDNGLYDRGEKVSFGFRFEHTTLLVVPIYGI